MIFEITFIIASLFQTYIYYLFSVCFYREKAEPKRVFGGCSIFFAVSYGIDHRNDGSFRSTCCYLYWSGWSKSGTAKSVL